MDNISTKSFFTLLLSICTVVVLRAQNTSLPYFNGFENPQDTVGWTFKKRPKTSGFEVGNAAHCLGYNSMYISPDGGATATYATSASGYVSIAYKSFTLPAGTYTLAFDYQCGGDGTNQDMKVAWAPASTTLAAASLGSSYPNAISLNQFTDASNNNTFGITAWKHVIGTINVAAAGTYNLCFAFRTNSQTVSAPGACVDNIQIDTVHANTDCVYPPYNLTVVKDPQYGVIVCWSGNATSYEVIAASSSDPTDYNFTVHDEVTSTCDTFQYNELSEGHFFFYVRPICGNDTGIYSETYDHLIYDVSAHCIDFITFNAPGTQCTYGTYSNPYATNGYIDNGPSQMSSRHTVHTDLNETDPRTGNGLHTVPMGEMMSVRLGNWNYNYEAESVTYTYNVPAGSSKILMMKYAVVFEEPGHDEPPEFLLEIMNMNGQLLDAVCTKANFLCDGTLTQGWHRSGAYWWKDWTDIGVNLTQYAGQTVKVRLTTKDCNYGGHAGYAYFTLNCTEAEFTGMSCGSGESTEIKAPDGFNYQWVNNCTGQTVSNAQSLPISDTDTCSYTCICSYKEQPSCHFSLTAYTIPRLPESSFSYSLTYSDCQTHITFTNNSQIYVLQGGVKTYLPNERITSQTWSVMTSHRGRSYYNKTSSNKNFQVLDIPKEGDTISITLTSWANGCDDDTTIVLQIPALTENHGVTNRYVCQGTPVTFNGEQYTFITRDSVEIVNTTTGAKRYKLLTDSAKSIQVIDTLKTWCGCDSILELNLKALITDTTKTVDTICSNQNYCLFVKDQSGHTVLDTCVNTPGHHDFFVRSSLACDSLYYSVDLVVRDVLEVGINLQAAEICADDSSFSATLNLSYGELRGYLVQYNDSSFDDVNDTTDFDGNTLHFQLRDFGSDRWDPATGGGRYTRPDNYVATVTLLNKYKECGDVTVNMPFTVQYPKDVILQRWNDFLGVRNSSFNGGYEFDGFRWYVDGQQVKGHNTGSQYYEEGEMLDINKQYQVALRRAHDTTYIKTCVFTPTMYDQSEVDAITATISESGSKTASNAPMRAKAQLYNSVGLLVGTFDFEEGTNYFDTPDEPGIYFMRYIFDDGSTTTVKFIVK
ncbi:MAG: hypothetical protein MJ002_07630 [Paludibacteraceae bacterium]|nr:hypothetical protein [Paludibacteraceae bacterium]